METFTHPITGETIQVAMKDFPEKLKWQEAINACRELGGGWRLPTRFELTEMYHQLKKIGKGGFEADAYWSSTEYSNSDDNGAWAQNFFENEDDGREYKYAYGEELRARAVRSL
jgi:hypothetical protein